MVQVVEVELDDGDKAIQAEEVNLDGGKKVQAKELNLNDEKKVVQVKNATLDDGHKEV